ncbi:MAG TPA: protein kinase [Kofleriaceae bacterium]|nr:protein kinase [Kofleriaceae bacterium]
MSGRGANAAQGDECPPDDVIAAHVAGKLHGEERLRVGAHLDSCESCRAIVVHAVRNRGADDEPPDPPSADPEALAATSPALPQVNEDTPLPPTGTPGAFAGRYQLQRLIGSGGMGRVYEAIDLNLHRLVALKVLRLAPQQREQREEAVNRLVREARAMAVLSHKNVVAVYDVGFHDQQVFVAMQLVDGATLGKWLAAEPRSIRKILRVLRDAGTGLAAAHAARLIHRDFKPDNVLVSKRGTARVTDFGLARRADLTIEPARDSTDRVSAPRVLELEDVSSVTKSGAIVGTPAYMAPEQSQGDAVDARADQFSFCVTAWEALYGKRPFDGETWSTIYGNVVNQRIEVPANPAVPRSIQRALRRGLSADPKDRFASMEPLLAIFDAALARPTRIRRALAIGGGAAALAAVIVIGRELVSPRDPEPVAAPVPPRVIATPAPVIAPDAAVVADVPTTTPTIDAAVPSAPVVPPKPTKVKPAKPAAPPQTTATTASIDRREDPRLGELATARRALDGVWQKRELLRGDLPADYATAVRAADTALAAADADAAATALDQARAAITGIVIDRGFIDRKLQRINARIQRLPPDRIADYGALLREVVAHVNAGDHIAANRKLNQIAGKLNIEP